MRWSFLTFIINIQLQRLHKQNVCFFYMRMMCLCLYVFFFARLFIFLMERGVIDKMPYIMDRFFLFLHINKIFTKKKWFYCFYLDYKNIFGRICRRKKKQNVCIWQEINHKRALKVFNQFYRQPCANNVGNLKLMYNHMDLRWIQILEIQIRPTNTDKSWPNVHNKFNFMFWQVLLWHIYFFKLKILLIPPAFLRCNTFYSGN